MISPSFAYALLGALGGALGLLVILGIVGKIPISYSFRNLLVRWPITFLTALAFTVVVGLLTILLAFVNGMYKVTEASGQPGNVMVLSDGATDELFSNLGKADTSDVENQPGVEATEYDGQQVPMCSKEVYMVINQAIPVKPGEKARRRFVQVRGIEFPAEIAGRVHGIKLKAGAWFSKAGAEERKGASEKEGESVIQAVLGEAVAGELGKDQDKPGLGVGDTFELGNRKWIVVGLLESRGSTFGSEIWAKQDLVGKQFGKERYTSIVLRTKDAAAAQKLADFLTKSYTKAALQAQPELVYYSKLSETNRQFLYAIGFVAAVMALGGIFGVMNTMFAAISQRIKDIGVLRILGYYRWQILVTFLLEAFLIGIIGGLIGCAIGYAFNGFTATSVVSGGQGSNKTVVLEMTVGADILALGMLFTLVMAGLGGFFPSFSAMRLKPLDAVR
jgi:ABC-type lipoprotein release transport system permease subunit